MTYPDDGDDGRWPDGTEKYAVDARTYEDILRQLDEMQARLTGRPVPVDGSSAPTPLPDPVSDAERTTGGRSCPNLRLDAYTGREACPDCGHRVTSHAWCRDPQTGHSATCDVCAIIDALDQRGSDEPLLCLHRQMEGEYFTCHLPESHYGAHDYSPRLT